MSNKKIKPTLTKGVAKVPVVMQLEALECGAASLAMVMAYYSKWVPLEQVRLDCGVSRDGSKAKNIYLAAEHYGFDVKAYRMSPEALKEKLDLIPGSVSPFGLLSNDACDVVFYLDKDFLEEPFLIGCHPNDNTATVFVKTTDMIKLIEAHGTHLEAVELPLRPAAD